MKIEQIITNYQGKLFIEGKITRDLEDIKRERDADNKELTKYLTENFKYAEQEILEILF